MNRRGFLRSVALGASAVAAAPLLNLIPPPAPPLVGISMRFIREFEIQSEPISRLDILYGMSVMRPDLGCRVFA